MGLSSDNYEVAGVCFFLENSASQAEGVLIKAREDFTAAIALRPKELAAFFNRAVIHQRLGHVDEAMADIDKVKERSLLCTMSQVVVNESYSWNWVQHSPCLVRFGIRCWS